MLMMKWFWLTFFIILKTAAILCAPIDSFSYKDDTNDVNTLDEPTGLIVKDVSKKITFSPARKLHKGSELGEVEILVANKKPFLKEGTNKRNVYTKDSIQQTRKKISRNNSIQDNEEDDGVEDFDDNEDDQTISGSNEDTDLFNDDTENNDVNSNDILSNMEERDTIEETSQKKKLNQKRGRKSGNYINAMDNLNLAEYGNEDNSAEVSGNSGNYYVEDIKSLNSGNNVKMSVESEVSSHDENSSAGDGESTKNVANINSSPEHFDFSKNTPHNADSLAIDLNSPQNNGLDENTSDVEINAYKHNTNDENISEEDLESNNLAGSSENLKSSICNSDSSEVLQSNSVGSSEGLQSNSVANNADSDELESSKSAGNNADSSEVLQSYSDANNADSDELESSKSAGNNADSSEVLQSYSVANNADSDEHESSKSAGNNADSFEVLQSNSVANNADSDELEPSKSAGNNAASSDVLQSNNDANNADSDELEPSKSAGNNADSSDVLPSNSVANNADSEEFESSKSATSGCADSLHKDPRDSNNSDASEDQESSNNADNDSSLRMVNNDETSNSVANNEDYFENVDSNPVSYDMISNVAEDTMQNIKTPNTNPNSIPENKELNNVVYSNRPAKDELSNDDNLKEKETNSIPQNVLSSFAEEDSQNVESCNNIAYAGDSSNQDIGENLNKDIAVVNPSFGKHVDSSIEQNLNLEQNLAPQKSSVSIEEISNTLDENSAVGRQKRGSDWCATPVPCVPTITSSSTPRNRPPCGPKLIVIPAECTEEPPRCCPEKGVPGPTTSFPVKKFVRR